MARVAAADVWLESPRFDVTAFFAPAGLATLAFASCVLLHASPLIWLWVWIIAFDGPHMLAAYTRAYGDAVLWRTRKRLLLGSPLAFAVGPALLLLGAWLHAPALFTVFLAAMSLYSFHHVVRQHWGFVSLYGARAKMRSARAERLWLYAVCWAPYVAFVLSHPSLRRQVVVSSALQQAGAGAALALAVVWLVATLRYGLRLAVAFRAQASLQQPAYLLLTALFHGLVFLIAARFEPIFSGASGLDQEFMLLSVMSGMFHSTQYVALVGVFHQRSARVADAEPTWFANRPGRTALVVAAFAALYASAACATGVYPGCHFWLGRELVPGVSVNQLALALWWGFALHHYWLDERIWHVRSDPRLQQILGLAPQVAASDVTAE